MEKPATPENPAWMIWTGRIISALPSLALLMSGVMKFVKPPGMEEGLKKIDWRMDQMTGLGILEVACTILYINPRTAVLGAVLLTGYLGGAIATHVRVDDDVVPHIVLGVLVWLGLFLRDARLRVLIPWRSL